MGEIAGVFKGFGEVLIAIPVWEMAVYVLLVAVLMLFGKLRACMVVTYMITLYWVFIENEKALKTSEEISTFFIGLFVVCGISAVALSVLAFYIDTDA